jgi:hypothetical protein
MRRALRAAARCAWAAGDGGVSRAPVGSYDRFAALSTHGAHVTFTGTGPGSVLELVGDQQAGAVAVISLDPGASDITVQRLMIDTSAATNTDEQTHAIAIGSGVCTPANGTCSMPVADVTVRDVVFAQPEDSWCAPGRLHPVARRHVGHGGQARDDRGWVVRQLCALWDRRAAQRVFVGGVGKSLR